MSLAVGRGPFGPRRAGEFNFDTDALRPHTLYFEPVPKRVRAFLGGEVVADSRSAKLLHETGLMPVYYFPVQDVDESLLRGTDHTTYCPFKGDAVYWNIEAGGKVAENALWGYPNPMPEAIYLKDYVAPYFGRMDSWMEEDEEIIGHPRDPYHRVDVLRGSQWVTVKAGGEIVAESSSPMVVFETGLQARYYLPPQDVNHDFLSGSETRTVCPYKGVASYWNLGVGETNVGDAAWSYPDPHPEASRIEDHLCFRDDADGIEVIISGQ